MGINDKYDLPQTIKWVADHGCEEGSETERRMADISRHLRSYRALSDVLGSLSDLLKGKL